MDKFLNAANALFEQMPDWVRRHRWGVWSAFLLINILIFFGATRFNIDMTLEAYFQAEDPAKKAYDRFRAEFGGDEGMVLLYEALDGDVFSNASLEAVKALQDELLNYRLSMAPSEVSELDHIVDVKTLVNAAYMEASESALISRPFIGDRLPASESQLAEWRTQALAHPDFPSQYFSDDLRYGVITIKTDFNAKKTEAVIVQTDEIMEDFELAEASENSSEFDAETEEINFDESWVSVPEVPADGVLFERTGIEDYAKFMAVVEPVLGAAKVKEHLKFYPVGNPPVMTFFSKVIMQEMVLVAGISILIIAIALWVLFRSLSAVLWSLVVVVVSFVWVVGIIGWSGAVMTFMINIIVFLILSVGVADSVHIMSGYIFFRRQGEMHEQALRSVFKKSGLACLLTSFTTAIGLCALILVPVVPIRNFGIFAGIGVIIAFLLTVTILPLLLDLWAPISRRAKINAAEEEKKQSEDNHLLQRYLQKIEHIGYTHPKQVIAGFTVVALIMLVGVFQVRVDSNIVEILPKDSHLRTSYDLVDSKLGGAQNMDMILETGTESAFKDPRMLNRLEQLEDYVLAEHEGLVGKTMSLVNVTKHAYQTLNNGDERFYVIPQDSRVLSQTLFLFNNANLKDRRQLVSDDFSRARFTITFKNAGSYIYSPVIDDIQVKADSLFADMKTDYPDLDVRLTGGMSLMMKLMDYVSWSQIQSFGLALLVISLLLFVVFSSKLVGALAIIPNLLPIVTAFGLMGYLGMALDTDTLLVAPIIIGIAVDDTIHFLTHYRDGILRFGCIRSAIHQTVREAGQAIAFTSIVLALGFFIFVLSSHMSLRHFGILSAVAIMVALITDLLLLPALCSVFKADFGYKTRQA